MNDVRDLINEAYAKAPAAKPRRYIGASGLGECEAEIAYSLRGFPSCEPEPRLARVFKLGHALEDMVVADLKMAGVKVQEVDPATGEQWAFKAYGGHVVCHLDGVVQIEDRPIVLEIKSMNKQLFSKLIREGVRVSHPKYFHQMQACMMLADMTEAMLCVYCKDNSEYHIEMVPLDMVTVSYLEVLITRALNNGARRVSDVPAYFKCKLCFKRGVCHGDAAAPRNCATCQKSLPHRSGGWLCTDSEEVNHADDVCQGYVRYAAKAAMEG